MLTSTRASFAGGPAPITPPTTEGMLRGICCLIATVHALSQQFLHATVDSHLDHSCATLLHVNSPVLLAHCTQFAWGGVQHAKEAVCTGSVMRHRWCSLELQHMHDQYTHHQANVIQHHVHHITLQLLLI